MEIIVASALGLGMIGVLCLFMKGSRSEYDQHISDTAQEQYLTEKLKGGIERKIDK